MLDADAVAYANAVSATGAAVSGAQKNLLSAFVAAEKSAGRWAAHKRLYFPIWGVAAANAICAKSLASGSFTASGVTHAAGYVQGNGTSGYFDIGTNANALGILPTSASATALVYAADTRTDERYWIGTQDGTRALSLDQNNSTMINWRMPSVNSNLVATGSGAGIYTGSTVAIDSRFIRRRTSGGAALLGSNTINDSISPAPLSNTFVMARNNGAAGSFSDAKLGAIQLGIGLSAADVDAFSLNLKTLWEGLTGLVLP